MSLVELDRAYTENQERAVSRMASTPCSILIVDDDPDLLKLLTFRLHGAGYHVESADSAERALAKLSVSVPDLVITDLRMGGMDGITLFENIRKTHPALPVIILTAHGTIPDAVAATQRGVFGYLTKPFDSKELLSQVEKAVSVSGVSGVGAEAADKDTKWREGIVTRSPIVESILAKAKLVAMSDASVLIRGDSGTGKEKPYNKCQGKGNNCLPRKWPRLDCQAVA